jgi:hypothetical protein
MSRYLLFAVVLYFSIFEFNIPPFIPSLQIWFQNRRYKFLQDERTMHFLWSTQGHVNFAARGTFTLEVPSPTAAALHHDQHYGGHIKEMYSSPTVTNIGDLKW